MFFFVFMVIWIVITRETCSRFGRIRWLMSYSTSVRPPSMLVPKLLRAVLTLIGRGSPLIKLMLFTLVGHLRVVMVITIVITQSLVIILRGRTRMLVLILSGSFGRIFRPFKNPLIVFVRRVIVVPVQICRMLPLLLATMVILLPRVVKVFTRMTFFLKNRGGKLKINPVVWRSFVLFW